MRTWSADFAGLLNLGPGLGTLIPGFAAGLDATSKKAQVFDGWRYDDDVVGLLAVR